MSIENWTDPDGKLLPCHYCDGVIEADEPEIWVRLVAGRVRVHKTCYDPFIDLLNDIARGLAAPKVVKHGSHD